MAGESGVTPILGHAVGPAFGHADLSLDILASTVPTEEMSRGAIAVRHSVSGIVIKATATTTRLAFIFKILPIVVEGMLIHKDSDRVLLPPQPVYNLGLTIES